MTVNSDLNSPGPPPDNRAVFVVEPANQGLFAQLLELWKYRELCYFLIWRDVKVRYKQTVLGVGWVILQPFLTMIVFSVVFGSFVKLPSVEVPYPIFVFAALLPWNYFSGAFSRSGQSLVNSANLVSKVYFPRLAVPIAAAIAGLADFVIALLMLVALMLFYSIAPTGRVIFLPLFVMLAVLCALGVGLWLSALNVKYRDVNYLIPFLVQIWMYATPVVYSTNLVPEQWRLLFSFNPMTGVIEGFRWALFGALTLDSGVLVNSILISGVLFVSGLIYFNHVEATLADVI